MKKNVKKLLAFALVLVLAFSLVACTSSDQGSSEALQEVKGQEYISKSDSADGSYTVTAYLNDGDGSSDYAVLCTVTDNSTGEERNLYWNNECANANIQWVDNETVVINGTVLNVKTGGYDYRDHQ